MAKTHYIWDYANDSYLMEKDETGATTAVYTNEPVPYGKLISQRRGDETSYYHFDGQGSTRQLTDQNANVTDEYMNSAFGEEVEETGVTENPFRWVGAIGYFRDAILKTYYIRARTYSSSVSRWMSADPLGLDGGSVNFFDHVRNNPIAIADPSGLLPTYSEPCCECYGAIYGKGVTHTVPHNKNPAVTIKCTVILECKTNCGGATGAGKTEDRVITKTTGIWEAEVRICISCDASPADLVVIHELVHAEDRCRGVPSKGCDNCIPFERKAATAHCNAAQKTTPSLDVKKCIECSVALSCPGCVSSPPTCTCKDIGLDKAPKGVDCNPAATKKGK